MATRKKEGAGPNVDKSRPPALSLDRAADVPVFSAAQLENNAQMKSLEQGLHLFQEHRFAEAREFFEKAAQGPQRSVMHAAKNHIVVCDRRTQGPAVALQTGDDHYNFGVERLNARDLEAARKHLALAVSAKPQCDHMLYALAAALALSGDAPAACENLKRAIQCDPRNRNAARTDPDFASLHQDPLYLSAVYPERA